MDIVLEVRGLEVRFPSAAGPIRAVDGVSFSLGRGETLGLVGESGCGKSLTALAIMRLLSGAEVHGTITLGGRDLLALDEHEMQEIRGNRISMIFQEPMTSLNPVLTIGDQIAEAFQAHQGLSGQRARDQAIEMLRLVQVPDPERRAREYPHQLSGGMRQRVMIAIALACKPEVLIADEPTTALDVTIQDQILRLMRELREQLGMSILMITHDLGVVAQNVSHVVVMYAGRTVEAAPVADLFENPQHPYSIGLLALAPHLIRARGDRKRRARLPEIGGMVPSPAALPRGCAFAPRCAHADERCLNAVPAFEQKRPGQWAACWHSDRIAGRPPKEIVLS